MLPVEGHALFPVDRQLGHGCKYSIPSPIGCDDYGFVSLAPWVRFTIGSLGDGHRSAKPYNDQILHLI